MALSNTNYRVKVDNTYTTTANATTAENAINTALAGLGRPETVTRTSANVFLLIVGLTEAQAVNIRGAILAAWSGPARSYGKVSVTRTNDTD